MSGESEDDKLELLQEAEEWERKIAHADSGSREAFAKWIRASPAHLHAYLVHLMFETELTNVDAAREFDLERLLADAVGDSSPPA